MIEASKQAEVLRLYYAENKSQREIALELGIHRQSVKAIVDRRKVHLMRSPAQRPPSILCAYHEQIIQLLKEDPERTSINILQKIRANGYAGGITTLRNYVKRQRKPKQRTAYLKLEFKPGEAAQVDWGDFGDPHGIGRKLWCFLMVLCYSRMLYIEFTHSATLENFLRCHENAFKYFGGIPKEIWYDNLASAVSERHHKIIKFNSKFMAYCGHCYFRPIACNPGCGHEKGRVEDGVKYVRNNFYPGRTFQDLDGINAQAREWLTVFANKRIHAASRKIPELILEQERPLLLQLQPDYDTDEKLSVKVSPQFRVRFDSNEYSVPWQLVGQTLTLRANSKKIIFYLKSKKVCSHPRCWQKGKSIVNERHQDGLLEQKPAAQQNWDIKTIQSLGENAKRYLDLLGAQQLSIKKEIKQLIVLITVYGAQSVEQTIGQLLHSGMVGVEHLERLLTINHQQIQPHPQPLTFKDPKLLLPPVVSDLRSYDALLFDQEE